MKQAFHCDGISTRQHNEPAGYQDDWHLHLHVFPRFFEDGFNRAAKIPYSEDEREQFALQLRREVGRSINPSSRSV